MALYSIAFSVSHIFSHNSGMHLVGSIGFQWTWYIMLALAILGVLLLIILKKITSTGRI